MMRRALAGAAIGFALLAAGCAPETAQYTPPILINGESGSVAERVPAPAATATEASVGADASDWLNRTYVYRGGRDPKTGLARTQL